MEAELVYDLLVAFVGCIWKWISIFSSSKRVSWITKRPV